MPDQPGDRPQVAVFLSSTPARAPALGPVLARVHAVDACAKVLWLLHAEPVDLLIVDTAGFDRVLDGAALAALIGAAREARVLLMCSCGDAGWLLTLAAAGAFDYILGPVSDQALVRAAAQILATPPARLALDAPGSAAWGDARAAVQRAVEEADGPAFAGAVCAALASCPGVVQAALFAVRAGGQLDVAAQCPALAGAAVDVTELLGSADRLLPVARGGALLIDGPEKSGEPELAMRMLTHEVAMLLAVPVRVGARPARGVLCLLFGAPRSFARAELLAVDELARLAGVGLRSHELAREAEELAGQLTRLATTDALTGVANRSHGEMLLAQEARRARRYATPLALIAFDIDRFRQLNAQYGHPCGDLALRTLAELVRGVLRSSDHLVRTGGEEFAVIAPHTDAVHGLKVAEKIRAAVAEAEFAGCDRLTVSLGVAQLTGEESPDRLMVRAHSAVERAKRAGRNCVELAMA